VTTQGKIMSNNAAAKTQKGVLTWVTQILVMTLITGIVLFLTAGRINWIGGWAFLGLNLLTQVISAIILIPRQPDMLAERTQAGSNTKRWDRFFAPAITIFGTFAIIITAGLDARFAWSGPIDPALWVSAVVLAFACQMFVLWAMASNRFFSTTVRIQQERGHQVVESGPYRIIRHPGYAGSVLYTLLIPLVLGSYWTYIPALLTVCLIVVRTSFEDQALKNELPGYADYASRVPHRLVPGLW
jgi:protein-S-isoprenylcysteine O-methyltransferase Ste14